MANTRNEHVFPRDGEWIVKREGNRKLSRLFGNKEDAMEYASIVALNDGGSVVSHKYNGQFKHFKPGNELHVRMHKIASIITGTVEMSQPISETIALV